MPARPNARHAPRATLACVGRIAARTLVALAALALAGCERPAPLAVPRQSAVTLAAHVVEWTTSEPTLGAVRYGRRPGAYDAVAYPLAAQRQDRAYATSHRVPLIGVAAGDTVFLQALDESASGLKSSSSAIRFVVGPRPASPPLLAWTMIDVGFGDSHLLTMPTTGAHVLVDAGERRDAENVERYLAASRIARLDVVIGTHIHEDHIGGLVGDWHDPDDGVLGVWDVGTLLDAASHSAERGAYDELLAILARRGIPRVEVNAGANDRTDAALAWDPSVRVAVLNAGTGRAIGGATESDWLNNDSIVLRLSYGDVDLMLGGDAESPVQSRLLGQRVALDAEALKVHHHAATDASEPAYLTAVGARVGLIPIVAYESFDGTLPSASIVERLRQRRTDVFASDRAEPLGIGPAGDTGYHVTLITDGASVEVRLAPSSSRHYPPDETAAVTGPVARGARP